ncbi:MAG: ammonium transporter [Acidobacteriaceae bacterium]|nr:ammonium transporter [Acidobacteriaceae bacterium]
MSQSFPAIPALSAAICTIFVLLIPFAAAGLALLNAGLTRTRSVAHSLFTSLCAIGIAAVVYFACGYKWQSGAGLTAHTLYVSGKAWDWLGTGPFFLRGLASSDARQALIALFGMQSAGICTLIPLGTGAERWRMAASFTCAAILAGFIYPVFAHWAWGNGWLAQLGSNHHLGTGFMDAAGSGCIHVIGGSSALSAAWLLRPRRGKYTASGMPTATPGHNAPLVLFGCLLALVGWFGLNTAGAILFARGDLPGSPLVLVNTLLSASGGGLSALAITRLRFSKPDASLFANGWVSGLVASSASAPFMNAAAALLVGLIAGTLVIFAIEIVELRMKVDDPAGAISVHTLGGLWGLLAVGLFTDSGQLAAQLVGIATLLGCVFPATYILYRLVNRFVPFRVASEGERQGMDLFELGAGAYPEFMIHREDFGLH